jgi:hypothetical protein
MDRRFSNVLGGPTQASGDIFRKALDDDAPTYAQLGIPFVNFEGEFRLWDEVELGSRTGAEDDNPAFHRVIDWKDLRLVLDVERYAAQVVRPK